jgi:hypothetical protein
MTPVLSHMCIYAYNMQVIVVKSSKLARSAAPFVQDDGRVKEFENWWRQVEAK